MLLTEKFWSAHIIKKFPQLFTGKKRRHIWEVFGAISWCQTPGIIIQKTTNPQKLSQNLYLCNYENFKDQYLATRQFFITIANIYLMIFLWFGDISWTNVIQVSGIYILWIALPPLYLQARAERKKRVLDADILEFIDLLILVLGGSGGNIDQNIQKILTHNQSDFTHKIAKKMHMQLFGKNTIEIIEESARLLENRHLLQVLQSITRAEHLGVSLQKTLKIQSQLIKQQKQQKAEALARTASVKISLPLVLFIFPALLLIYLGPVIIQMSQ